MKLLTTVYGNCDLTPSFIKHYEALGVTSIHCIINKNRHPYTVDQLQKYSKNTIFSIDKVIDEEYDTQTFIEHLEQLKNELVDPHEWYMKVDLDEFVEFLTPLDVLLKNANAAGNDVIKGKWLDRIAEDGSLAIINPNKSIEEQFPLGGSISTALCQAVTHKSVVIKGNKLKLFAGCHFLDKEKPHSTLATIHHYKWTSTLLPRMRQRADYYKKIGKFWWGESQNIFEYFSEHGKLDVNDPRFTLHKMYAIKKKSKFKPQLNIKDRTEIF